MYWKTFTDLIPHSNSSFKTMKKHSEKKDLCGRLNILEPTLYRRVPEHSQPSCHQHGCCRS